MPHAPLPDSARSLTALQKHVAFFDRDGDDRVTVNDVYDTLRMLGCSRIYARANALGGMLARTTEPEFASHDVVISNAHRGKYRDAAHDGETRIFDDAGDFDTARFDEVLTRYGRSNVDGLTQTDIDRMIKDISQPESVARSSAELAFRLLMTIAGEETPSGELMLSRSKLRAFYEGDLFPSLLALRTDARNKEAIASTIGGIAVGAVRAICPFRFGHEALTTDHQRTATDATA